MSSCSIKDILMREQMNYTLTPSLEHGALIKMATILWNQDNIWHLITKHEIIRSIRTERQKMWLQVEDQVKENIHRLPLPESLKLKVSYFIKPIGFEILKWSKYHSRLLPEHIYTRFVRESSNKLCWTSRGTIDRKETVQTLIKNGNLYIAEQFILACIYCLKNDILTLWNKMPENCRRSYYFSFNMEASVHTQEKLVLFWTYDTGGDLYQIKKLCESKWNACTNYKNAFENAVSYGNKVAIEYFLQKLTSEERKESLVESAERIIYGICNYTIEMEGTDVLCFLLSQMNEEQHLKMLKKYSYQVLERLLEWPRQGSFVEMAKHVWAFLPIHFFSHLVSYIIHKIKYGFKDFNYLKLFREFWQQSPITHKEYVIHNCARSTLIVMLDMKDKEIIKLILDDACTADREKVIFSKQGKYTCESLIYGDKMDSLEFFLRECIPSKDIMIKFRKEFEEHTIYVRSKETREDYQDRWCKFCQFFNDLIQTYD